MTANADLLTSRNPGELGGDYRAFFGFGCLCRNTSDRVAGGEILVITSAFPLSCLIFDHRL